MALTRHAVIRQNYCQFAANIVSISLRLLSLGWRLGPREPATSRVTLRAEPFKVLLNSSCDKKDVWYGMRRREAVALFHRGRRNRGIRRLDSREIDLRPVALSGAASQRLRTLQLMIFAVQRQSCFDALVFVGNRLNAAAGSGTEPRRPHGLASTGPDQQAREEAATLII